MSLFQGSLVKRDSTTVKDIILNYWWHRAGTNFTWEHRLPVTIIQQFFQFLSFSVKTNLQQSKPLQNSRSHAATYCWTRKFYLNMELKLDSMQRFEQNWNYGLMGSLLPPPPPLWTFGSRIKLKNHRLVIEWKLHCFVAVLLIIYHTQPALTLCVTRRLQMLYFIF